MSNTAIDNRDVYYHESDSDSGRETYSEREWPDAEEWYSYGDKLWAESVQVEIAQTFAKSRSLMRFDEINALDASVEIKRLYKELKALLVAFLLRIAKHTRRRVAHDYVVPLGEDGMVSTGSVKQWMGRYSPVTRTQMTSDIERRRALLFEAIMVSQEVGRTGGQGAYREGTDAYDRAQRSWERLARQGAIDIEDDTALDTLRGGGVERVRWITERDAKVCEECRSRDDVVYPIDAVPPKPHPRCRCHIVPA